MADWQAYSTDDCRSALRAVADLLGRPPTVMEYREHGPADGPAGETIRQHYADHDRPWIAALVDAELDPDLGRHGGTAAPTKQDARQAYTAVAAHLAAWPSPDEYRDAGALPSVPTLYRLYGSWGALRDASRSTYRRVDRLISDGPMPQQEYGGLNPIDRRMGVRQYRQTGGAYIVYLPGHDADAVAAAFVDANRRMDYPTRGDRHGVDEETAAIKRAIVNQTSDASSADDDRDRDESGRDEGSRRTYSDDDIEDALRTVADRVEGVLERRQYDEHRDDDHPSGQTIWNRVGWDAAKRAVGLETHSIYREDAVAAVRAVAGRVDGPLTMRAYDAERDESHPTANAISRKWGWNDVKESAGLETTPAARDLTVSREEVREAVREVAERTDRPLTSTLYESLRADSQPASSTVSRKYGWDAVRRDLGLEPAGYDSRREA